MNIAPTPEQLHWLEGEVAAGHFTSVEEGARLAIAALMAVASGGTAETDDLDWAKPLVDVALAEIERGEGIPAERVRAEMDAWLRSIGAR